MIEKGDWSVHSAPYYVVSIINHAILRIMVVLLSQLNGVLVITHTKHKILMNNIIHDYNILILIKTQCLVYILA
jgi:hypothetical protein